MIQIVCDECDRAAVLDVTNRWLDLTSLVGWRHRDGSLLSSSRNAAGPWVPGADEHICPRCATKLDREKLEHDEEREKP